MAGRVEFKVKDDFEQSTNVVITVIAKSVHEIVVARKKCSFLLMGGQ